MADSTDTQYLLEWAPGGGLTYDEWHAGLLGLVGTVAGLAVYAGAYEAAATFSMLVLGVAWGLKRLPESKHRLAARVVRREPWYFTAVYVASATAALGGLEVLI